MLIEYVLTRIEPTWVIIPILLVGFAINSAHPIAHYLPGIQLLYLPAGLQVLAIFVYDARGVLPVALATTLGLTLFSWHGSIDLNTVGLISLYALLSAQALFWILSITSQLTGLNDTLKGLNFRDVVLVTATQSVLDAGLRLSLFHWLRFDPRYQDMNAPEVIHYLLALSTGNLLGAMTIILLLLVSASAFRVAR